MAKLNFIKGWGGGGGLDREPHSAAYVVARTKKSGCRFSIDAKINISGASVLTQNFRKDALANGSERWGEGWGMRTDNGDAGKLNIYVRRCKWTLFWYTLLQSYRILSKMCFCVCIYKIQIYEYVRVPVLFCNGLLFLLIFLFSFRPLLSFFLLLVNSLRFFLLWYIFIVHRRIIYTKPKTRIDGPRHCTEAHRIWVNVGKVKCWISLQIRQFSFLFPFFFSRNCWRRKTNRNFPFKSGGKRKRKKKKKMKNWCIFHKRIYYVLYYHVKRSYEIFSSKCCLYVCQKKKREKWKRAVSASTFSRFPIRDLKEVTKFVSSADRSNATTNFAWSGNDNLNDSIRFFFKFICFGSSGGGKGGGWRKLNLKDFGQGHILLELCIRRDSSLISNTYKTVEMEQSFDSMNFFA